MNKQNVAISEQHPSTFNFGFKRLTSESASSSTLPLQDVEKAIGEWVIYKDGNG